MLEKIKGLFSARRKKRGAPKEYVETSDTNPRLFKRYVAISNWAYAIAFLIVVISCFIKSARENLRVIVWVAFAFVLVGMIASAIAGTHNGSMMSRFTTGAWTEEEIEKKYRAHQKAEQKFREKGLLDDEQIPSLEDSQEETAPDKVRK